MLSPFSNAISKPILSRSNQDSNSENTSNQRQVSPTGRSSSSTTSAYRRARAETLPSSFLEPKLQETGLSLGGYSTGTSTECSSLSESPFRSRMGSFAPSETWTEKAHSFLLTTQPTHSDRLAADLKPQPSPTTMINHYQLEGNRTLDWLGLNENDSSTDSSSVSDKIIEDIKNLPSKRTSQASRGPLNQAASIESLISNEAIGRPRSSTMPSRPNLSNLIPSALKASPSQTNKLPMHPEFNLTSLSLPSTAEESEPSEATMFLDSSSSSCEALLLSSTLIISSLPKSISFKNLVSILSEFGEPTLVQCDRTYGLGWVTFEDRQSALKLQSEAEKKPLFGAESELPTISFCPDNSIGIHPFRSDLVTGASNIDDLSGLLGFQHGFNRDTSSVVPAHQMDIYNSVVQDFQTQLPDLEATADQVSRYVPPGHFECIEYEYAITLPPIPNPNLRKKIDAVRLRELRKLLESEMTPENFVLVFEETKDCWVDLCSDYIGNIIIQKLVEHGDVGQKTYLIQSVAPHMAAIGVHKNGTWAIQKMIECSTTNEQMDAISSSLKPFTPILLLDQFGNYVVQCCLQFTYPYNQFIFDAIYARCSEIGQGRYGARAIRTCLDSQYTNPNQKEQVATALMHSAVPLSTNGNGSLLLNWLLDSHDMERYMGIAVKINATSQLSTLCTHKLASALVIRLINQEHDIQTREYLIYLLFFSPDGGPDRLLDVLSTPSHVNYSQATQFLQKVLTSPYLSEDLKIAIQVAVQLHKPATTPAASSSLNPPSDGRKVAPGTGHRRPRSMEFLSSHAGNVTGSLLGTSDQPHSEMAPTHRLSISIGSSSAASGLGMGRPSQAKGYSGNESNDWAKNLNLSNLPASNWSIPSITTSMAPSMNSASGQSDNFRPSNRRHMSQGASTLASYSKVTSGFSSGAPSQSSTTLIE